MVDVGLCPRESVLIFKFMGLVLPHPNLAYRAGGCHSGLSIVPFRFCEIPDSFFGAYVLGEVY